MHKGYKYYLLFGLIAVLLTALVVGIVVISKGENKDNEDQELPQTQTYVVKFIDYDDTPLGVLIDGKVVYEQQVESGHPAIAPTNPNRVGYRFSSWSKDYSSISANTDVYAQYVQVCEVLFLDYDFSVYETQIVDYGKNARLPDVDPTREGYRFDYWEGRLTNIISNAELNAVYVKQWTVTFVDFDDTELKVQLVDEGGSATAPQNPTRQGEYVFDHWDREFANVSENIVVKAVYRVATYSVTFKDYDGTILKEQVVYKGEGATAPDLSEKIYVDFVSIQKQGYRFVCWDKEFSNIVDNLTVTAVYEQVTTPILYVETEVVEGGNNQTVGVSVYIISPTSFSALNIDVKYDENLSLTQNDVIVKNIFGTQNKYTVNVDTVEHELEFSWVYSTNEYTLTNNYAEVFEMRFQIDKYIAQGDYLIQLLSSCVYVKDYENNVPIVISGAVKVV